MEREHGLRRVSTGNASADEILGGGFPASTINIVMGQPGTGKTIFVEQLLFANAGGERPVLYFTTLSEPLAKVVRFVQEFDFYDEDRVGTGVIYQDIGADLAENGIPVLVPLLEEAIKTIGPAIIVIDSFRAVRDLSDSIAEVRRVVHDLTGLLTAYDTTAFLVGEYHQEDIRHHPEFAVADAVVEFSRRALGTRDERYFRVLKLRGSRYLEGAHAFRITDHGLVIHPRLVTPRVPQPYEPAVGRVPTGVPKLDTMLDGGLPEGSATLLAGPSGSGKTTLALQFALEGIRRGEGCLCVNFQENPTQLSRTVDRLARDAATARALDIMYSSPVELQIDSIIVEMFRRIDASGVRRVVLDAIGDLAAATEAPRLHDYLYALIQHLAVRGVTSILTLENAALQVTGAEFNTGPISYMADNLILLDMRGEETTRRTIRVLKARGSAHDPAAREIAIGPAGIRFT
jgi:circadian clock protein KaiC